MKWKRFFSHMAGSLDSSVWGAGGSGDMFCTRFRNEMPHPPICEVLLY